MWLITPVGFFSIVQKPGDKQNDTLTVRSRVRSDLAALKQHYLPGLGLIQESHDTDYRFRAVAPRSEVSAAMGAQVARCQPGVDQRTPRQQRGSDGRKQQVAEVVAVKGTEEDQRARHGAIVRRCRRQPAASSGEASSTSTPCASSA